MARAFHDRAGGRYLERLNDLGVRNVPLLVAHGDVPEEDDTFQKTGPYVFASYANFLNQVSPRRQISTYSN